MCAYPVKKIEVEAPKVIQVDATSLLGLKAELDRKREAFKQARLNQNSSPKKREHILKKENAHKKEKTKKASVVINDADEEEIALKKSRMALEAKTSLYEHIISKKEVSDLEQENYLVDFQKKFFSGENDIPVSCVDDSKNENNVKKDFSHAVYGISASESAFQNSSSNVKHISSQSNTEKDTSNSVDSNDGPIHYQNIQFNEVRDHGIGYFAFSTDEEKRKQQMDMLNTLHKDTEQKKSTWEHLQKVKRAKLQARLAKICQRRNIDDNVIKNFMSTEDSDDSAVSGSQQSSSESEGKQAIILSDIPLPEETPVTSPKPVKVRPWDIGKTDLNFQKPNENKLITQQQWIEDRRSERDQEFAPPTVYFPHSSDNVKKKKI